MLFWHIWSVNTVYALAIMKNTRQLNLLHIKKALVQKDISKSFDKIYWYTGLKKSARPIILTSKIRGGVSRFFGMFVRPGKRYFQSQ